jgi:hypothetical protein
MAFFIRAVGADHRFSFGLLNELGQRPHGLRWIEVPHWLHHLRPMAYVLSQD